MYKSILQVNITFGGLSSESGGNVSPPIEPIPTVDWSSPTSLEFTDRC